MNNGGTTLAFIKRPSGSKNAFAAQQNQPDLAPNAARAVATETAPHHGSKHSSKARQSQWIFMQETRFARLNAGSATGVPLRDLAGAWLPCRSTWLQR